MRRASVVVALAVLLAVAGCGGDGGGTPAEDTTTPTETTVTTAGEVTCTSVEAPEPRNPSAEAPRGAFDEAKTYTLTFTTNCGVFVVTLDTTLAPNTAASLVSLVRQRYYDNTTFHRIVPGFVIQGGDPGADGSGDPGYKTVDVPPAEARYVRGVVAMAKTAVEAPGTAGSQFFVVTGGDAALPPDYAIVGKVTSGLDVVAKIGTLGGADQQPTQPVVIESVTVTVT